MEIRHTICRHFKMIIGEIGPVEVELVFTLIFGFTGAVFGVEVFDKQLNDLFGTDFDLIHSYQLKHILAGLVIVLNIMFTIDNIKDAYTVNSSEAFRLFVPVFVLISFS